MLTILPEASAMLLGRLTLKPQKPASPRLKAQNRTQLNKEAKIEKGGGESGLRDN